MIQYMCNEGASFVRLQSSDKIQQQFIIMSRVTESNVLDCISATELCSALRHLKALSKMEMEEQKVNSIVDVSFSQQRSHVCQSKRSKNNHKNQVSLSFQLYQSKRLEQKAQKTARKKAAKPEFPQVKEVRVNPKSQSIIKQKQQKGQKWLPIYLRTQKDLQKKKQNIQKLRSKLQSNRVDDSFRECTFKPQLNLVSEEYAAKLKKQNGGRIDNIHNACSTNYKKDNKENILVSSREIQEALMERKQEKQRSVTPSTKKEITKSRLRIKTQQYEETPYVPVLKIAEQKSKPKNKSFNILLDLIK